MPIDPTYRAAPRHQALGRDFFDPVEAADFPSTTLRYRNRDAAAEAGLSGLSDAEWVNHFGRFEPLPDNLPEPLALRYHGHQFRQYNPDLGDGRGFLFAQLLDRDDRLLDLGTKGSGQTPWSRQGDGRLTLKGGVREVLATTMLEALGVNTSRSFSLVETGEELMRGDEPSPTRSSVLVRLSHSHIRIGTFQRFAYLEQPDRIEALLHHAVANYMPDCARADTKDTALAFLDRVCRNVARTGAQWMAAGFVHGVLNTDNINITGESFDYGPWRFLPVLDPSFTAAYFDQTGLYAFGRQPETLFWNLARLAECLLPLAPLEDVEPIVRAFPDHYRLAFDQQIVARLGLEPLDAATDRELAESFWKFLAASAMPFEQVFFDWFGGVPDRAGRSPVAAEYAGETFAQTRALIDRYQTRADIDLAHPSLAALSPVTVLIDDVERIWSGIDTDDDWSEFHETLDRMADLRDAYRLKERAR
jgi:serine/tyrosine/threonine adenylyltransferase